MCSEFHGYYLNTNGQELNKKTISSEEVEFARSGGTKHGIWT